MDLSTLGDRAWEHGRLSVAARLRRLQSKAWMIGQCGLAAGAAWLVGRHVFGHPTPFFAPVAAVVCLGTSYGQRLRRVAEVSIGVSIGIGTADLFTHLVGHGAWQITLIVACAMAAAVLLDAGVLFVNQAAVQSIVVATLLPLDGGRQPDRRCTDRGRCGTRGGKRRTRRAVAAAARGGRPGHG